VGTHRQINEMGDNLDFALELGASYSVGRTEDNNCTIPYGTVSGAHAVIDTTADGELYISDMGSTNGTKVRAELTHFSRSRSPFPRPPTLTSHGRAHDALCDAGVRDIRAEGGVQDAGAQPAFQVRAAGTRTRVALGVFMRE
jgi:hypothetical protein